MKILGRVRKREKSKEAIEAERQGSERVKRGSNARKQVGQRERPREK